MLWNIYTSSYVLCLYISETILKGDFKCRIFILNIIMKIITLELRFILKKGKIMFTILPILSSSAKPQFQLQLVG